MCFDLSSKLLEKWKKDLTDVKVGGRPHLSVFRNDVNDQRVAHQSHQHDEAEEEGNQPGVREERVLSFPLIFVALPASPQGRVCLGSVRPEMFG